MRVLHVILRLEPGGAERVVMDLVRELRDEIESEVCCLDSRGAWGDELAAEGTPVHVIGREPGFDIGLAWKLAALARERDVDLLHCHQYTPWVYGTLSRFFYPAARVVLTEHGRAGNVEPGPKRRFATRVLRLPRARMVSVCEDLRAFMAASGFRAGRIEVIPNGVRMAPIVPEQPRGQFTVGTIARLDPVKRIDDLVRAVGRCPTPLRLVIIGDGPARAAIEACVRESGIEADTLFLGYRADARDQLRGFDVFVNCSEQEGMSLAILEAMAASRPIVATAVGGTSEVLRHETTALLVEPRRPDQIAAALERLAGDAKLRRDLGARARAHVEREYSLATMIERYRALYREEAR